MRIIDEGRVVLVESDDDVIQALRQTSDVPTGVTEHLIKELCINFNKLPKVYPYVLVTTFVSNGVFSYIDPVGITRDTFDLK